MNFIKCEKLEKSMAELQFSIDAEAFKGAVADVFKKEGKKYSVPGFRKGKAPRSLIEKMYGADVFTYDAINELFPAAYEAAVKEAGIEPVGRPEVSVDAASETEGVTLTVKVAVMPEVKVGNYNGLTVEKTVHTVTDEAVDAEAFKKAVADVFKKEGKKYPVQGFRKGKAPKALIEKMYGADVFTYDAINELFPEAFEAAAKEAGVEPVGRPEVSVDSASEAEGATLTVKVAVKPEIKVGSYNGLTVEKTVHTVTDEAVDAELKRVQERNARELTREGAAENGDIADIDFEGFVDGVAFEGGKAEHYNLTLGSGSFIPGFEDQIVGHSAGEEFDVNVTFPEEYQAAELAGKAAVFKIKLHEVKYKELPALDDELAKDCSEYDTLEEFKESIRKNNQEQLDKQDDLAVENALVDQVIESMEAEIPQAMYDTRMDEMVNDFAFRVEQQGLRLEDYLKYMGQTVDQFRASFMPQAEKQVKIRLALEAVAAAENIEASEEDVSAEIKRIADQYKMEEDKVRELVNVDDLKKDLAINKAIDFIKSHANIVEKAAEAEKTEDAE